MYKTPIELCFYCHKPKDTNVNLDNINTAVFLNYIPCETCQTHMDTGITLMGVLTEPQYENHLHIETTNNQKVYPTGNIAVITEEAIKLFYDEPYASDIISKKGTFMNDADVKKIIEIVDAMNNDKDAITKLGD